MISDIHGSKHVPEIQIHLVNATKSIFSCILLSIDHFNILLHKILEVNIIPFNFPCFVVIVTES